MEKCKTRMRKRARRVKRKEEEEEEEEEDHPARLNIIAFQIEAVEVEQEG